MSLSKKLKKGGEARVVLQGAVNNDFFTLPRGFHIRYTAVENLSVLPLSGTVSFGKVAGAYTTASFAVTTAITTSAQTFTWGGGASGTFLTTTASATGATLASTAAFIAAASPVQMSAGLVGTWIVTSSGASVTMISSVPGNFTAPTLSMGGTGAVIGSVTTVAGSVDVTYLPATPITSTFGSITNVTPSLTAANTVNSSQIGTTLSVTFTGAAGAAGTYYIGSNQGLNAPSAYVTPGVGPGLGNVLTGPALGGTAVAIPNGLAAIATGFVTGGYSYYQFTITGGGGAGTNFINSTSFTSSATPSTAATNLAATYVPGWIILAVGAVVTMYATSSGFTPAPVFTAGTATVITIGTITTLPGFSVPSYVLQSTTPVTNTVTVTSTAASTGKVAVNGISVQIANSNTVAQSAAVIAGASFYQFTVATSPAGNATINGIPYVSSGTQATTATNIAALAIPGWTVTAAAAVVTMIGTTAGVILPVPTFAFAAGLSAMTTSSVTYLPGFTLPGYTQSYTATTAVLVGPAPTFQVLVAPTTQTYGFVYTFAGSTGSFTMSVSQALNPGAPAPFISGALTTQTYTQSTTLGDLPYYVNFSQEPAGMVNVYALLEKLN